MEIKDLRDVDESVEPVRPYYPFLAALEEGVVSLEKVHAVELAEPLGVMLQNGHLPAVNEAGLISLGGENYAIDHAYVLYADEKEIHIGPANKDDVTSDGKVIDSGTFILTRISDGFQVYLGKAMGGNVSAWLNPGTHLGHIAIKLYGIEAPRAEPKEVEEGIIVAKLWTP